MAQLVERYVRNVQATSSNLVISTKRVRNRTERKVCYTVTDFFIFSGISAKPLSPKPKEYRRSLKQGTAKQPFPV